MTDLQPTADTSFTIVDDTLPVTTVIGDDKQPDFQPQLKIQGWDNETNLSVRATDTDGVHSVEGSTIVYTTPSKTISFYPVDPTVDQAGGFEFQIVLNKKPDSNVIPLTVQTKGLEFHYQPAVDEPKHTRPDNVVGSFAAYHDSKQDNEYQTGKAFHMYRPWAVDSAGTRVWCEYDPGWDYANNADLNITIPQAFLDTAVFPVLVDPTFGYTTAGASSVNLTDGTGEFYGLRNVTGAAGTVSSIAYYMGSGFSSDERIVAGLYQNSNGSRQDYTAQEIIATGAAAWHTRTAQVGATISAIGYDLVVSGLNGNGFSSADLYYDTVSNAGGNKQFTAYSTPPPSTEPTLTTDNNRYSLYVTYTAGGGSTPISSSDTGTATENTPSVGMSNSDTSSGTEPTPNIGTTGSDTATAVENTPTIGASNSDVGTAVENNPTIGLPASDTATATEPTAAIGTSNSDTATATESTPSIGTSNTDAGTTTESGVLAAVVQALETAFGVDAATLTAALASNDTGSGTDTGSASPVGAAPVNAASASTVSARASSASSVSDG